MVLPSLIRLTRRSPRRKFPRGKRDKGGVPVDPNKPKTLSGGAAAELEFDE